MTKRRINPLLLAASAFLASMLCVALVGVAQSLL